MSVTTIIDDLTRRGYRLFPKPGNILRVEPTPPSEVVAMLREHKLEILVELRRQQTPAMATVAARLARTPTGGAEVEQAVKAPELTLYVGRRDGLRAWSRWPLDDSHWAPELN